ncbi:MAG: 5-oxoprolinase subunit PxpA [Pyrinomonadaceae bacterium]
MTRSIDLNCDMGEGFGNDAALMKYVSSANIACGFHAGDASTMRRTVELAIESDTAIGAHPGYFDPQGFGRNAISLPLQEVSDIVLYQVSALKGICESFGADLRHVKPHGALYNQAAKDEDLARCVAAAVKSIDRDLILYGLYGSFLISAAKSIGLRTASEAFADRTYKADGTLSPRFEPNSLISIASAAADQVIRMIRTRTIEATDGTSIPIRADTICIHGDGDHSVELAAAIRQAVDNGEIDVKPPYRK